MKHGHNKRSGASATYRTWNAMRQRCENPKNQKFPQYGGRGVSVCRRWKSFELFLLDMGERPDGTTIDRIDGEKGYSPKNCRWATPKQQQRNVKSNVNITLRGETRTLSEWAECLGISASTLRYRLARGWTDEQITSTPAKVGQRLVKRNYQAVTAFGETLFFSEWEKRFGVKPNTIRERLRRGIDPETAVSQPPSPAGKKIKET
ncbi:MAG TPA: hypothetical protein PLX33_11460 [Alphaproteobacteria bacterium]|nr:hypothetical protein [Alphaproteobacteria bacterium]